MVVKSWEDAKNESDASKKDVSGKKIQKKGRTMLKVKKCLQIHKKKRSTFVYLKKTTITKSNQKS